MSSLKRQEKSSLTEVVRIVAPLSRLESVIVVPRVAAPPTSAILVA